MLFATLLALTAAHPPSSGEEIAEQEEKNIASPDELIVRFLKIEKSYKNKWMFQPEIVEQQNFWPPVHLRGLR